MEHLKKTVISVDFASCSAAALFFKTILCCLYLTSVLFNFCDELGERKMQCAFLQACLKATSSFRVSVKSCKALQRHQVFSKCHMSAWTWTSVSETFPIWAESGRSASWQLQPLFCLWLSWELGAGRGGYRCPWPGQPGHSAGAEECSDPCGSFLLLQLDLAPPLCIAFCCGQGYTPDTYLKSKKAIVPSFVGLKIVGVMLPSHKNTGLNIDLISALFFQGAVSAA